MSYRRQVEFCVAMGMLVVITAACGGGGTGASSGVKVAKLGHALTTTSTYQKGGEKFASLVAQKTGGSVQIKIYPNGQLGDEASLLSGLKAGSVDFALAATSVVGTYDPELSALVLPFLCSTPNCIFHVLDGPVGQKVYGTLESKGIKELTSFEAGFRNLATKNTPPTSLDAIRGLTVRVPPGDLYMRTWKALGAVPTPIAWTETFTALQTGVVQGTEPPLSTWSDAKFYEVQKNYAVINYLYDPIMFGVSTKFWKSLSHDQQVDVQSAATEAAAYERNLATDQNSSLQAKLASQYGVKFFKPDVAPFREAVKPVIDYYAKQLGPVVGEVQKAAAQYK